MDESLRGKMGMSGIVQSFAGFAAAWLVHLASLNPLRSLPMPILFCLLGVVAPVTMDLYELKAEQHGTTERRLDAVQKKVDGIRSDVLGHVSGFAVGVLLYCARSRVLATPVVRPFALH
jgi:hypothetical protein